MPAEGTDMYDKKGGALWVVVSETNDEGPVGSSWPRRRPSPSCATDAAEVREGSWRPLEIRSSEAATRFQGSYCRQNNGRHKLALYWRLRRSKIRSMSSRTSKKFGFKTSSPRHAVVGYWGRWPSYARDGS